MAQNSVVLEKLEADRSDDDHDCMEENITVTNLDIIMYVIAIVGYFVDLGCDINVAVRYYLAGMMSEFGWTLALILVPAFVNTAISTMMYAKDKQKGFKTCYKHKWPRIFILILQMAPVLRITDALIYALKNRHAQWKRDKDSQEFYYHHMKKENLDILLLRIFECFLETAPQLVLQTTLLLRHSDVLTVHILLSMGTSLFIGIGLCLAMVFRTLSFGQGDNWLVTWLGTGLLTLWHFLICLSRISSLSAIALLFPNWTILACFIHISSNALLLLTYSSSFFPQNRMADIALFFALGGVYLFVYVLQPKQKSGYISILYYTVFLIQNIICGNLWYYYVSDTLRFTVFFLPILVCTIVPFVLGLIVMLIYYKCFLPRIHGYIVNSASYNIHKANCAITVT